MALVQCSQLHTFGHKVRGVCPTTNHKLRDLGLDLPYPGMAIDGLDYEITDSVPVPSILLACIRGVAGSGTVGPSPGNRIRVPAATRAVIVPVAVATAKDPWKSDTLWEWPVEFFAVVAGNFSVVVTHDLHGRGLDMPRLLADLVVKFEG